uniref:Uncharacterized protein n=1 Tax=viral metagenome TaxID=1070528 RepID=A0A6C0AH24_9ZZZZ|tara:strand:+ start:15361 stop:15624 length:264 start_codon:yes stop_codon:yes gene_type:complete
MNNAYKVFHMSELANIIKEYARQPKHFRIWENYEQLEICLNASYIGDTIMYLTSNQLGCVMYKVCKNENNEKYLEQIWNAEDEFMSC